MNVEDVRATKYARSAFGKRGIDLGMADLRVQHGVCFVRGMLKALPKWDIQSVEKEATTVAGMIKRQEHIKEVVMECSFRESSK